MSADDGFDPREADWFFEGIFKDIEGNPVRAFRRLADQRASDFWHDWDARFQAALAGRPAGREPTEREVEMLIRDVSGFLSLKAGKDRGKCGATPPGKIAGGHLFCDLLAGHSSKVKHRNRHTGYTWWS